MFNDLQALVKNLRQAVSGYKNAKDSNAKEKAFGVIDNTVGKIEQIASTQFVEYDNPSSGTYGQKAETKQTWGLADAGGQPFVPHKQAQDKTKRRDSSASTDTSDTQKSKSPRKSW